MRIECLESVPPTERDAIIELLGAARFKQLLWEWQFHAKVGDRARTLIVAYDDDGSVIGFNGSIPVAVQLKEKTVPALWSCDFIVSAACRGKGIGHSLKRELLGASRLVMALGLSAAADRVHASMGWTRGPSVRSFTRLQKPRGVRSFIKLSAQYLQSFAYRVREPRWRFGYQVELCELHTLREEAQALWERVRSGYDNIVVRDWSYLEWRYASHPLARYRAVCARDARGDLIAFGIFWRSSRRAVLVDYVGPRHEPIAKDAIVRGFLEECRGAPVLDCATTDPELQISLQRFGFVHWRERAAAFNYFVPGEYTNDGAWFLMGGDSDGDILEAARSSDPYVINVWGEEEFLSAREEWTALLARSRADRLFLSWEWQSAWWRTFGAVNHLDLRILAVRDARGTLVGIAPLYLHHAKQRNVSSRRLQFIGNIWRGPATMRTEYLEFLLDAQVEDEVAAALCAYLERDRSWDDMVLTDLCLPSVTRAALEASSMSERCYFRTVERFSGYGVSTRVTFEEYLRSLSGSRRRKLFHQRRKLEQLGAVSLIAVERDEFPEFARRLDRLHECRWGKPFFVGRIREFHERLVADLPPQSKTHLSLLQIDGVDVSAAYNLRVQGREYNLQGGFDETAARGLSLGLIHNGFIIEKAFADSIECVDLLVGGGKHDNFKARIADVVRQSATLHIVRAPLLQIGFRAHDAMKERSKR